MSRVRRQIHIEDAEKIFNQKLGYITSILRSDDILTLVDREGVTNAIQDAKDSLVLLKKDLPNISDSKNPQKIKKKHEEFKKNEEQIDKLSNLFVKRIRDDEIRIQADESQRVAGHHKRTQTTELDKGLIDLFLIKPDEPRILSLDAKFLTTSVPPKGKQLNELKLNQEKLSAYYAKYDQSVEIKSLSPNNLEKLTKVVDKLKEADEAKMNKYKERIHKFEEIQLKMFHHLFTVIPYELLDSKIKESNDISAIVTEYIRLYKIYNLEEHNVEDRVAKYNVKKTEPEGYILRPPRYADHFNLYYKEYRNLEDKVQNREEHVRFYQFRIWLRELIHSFQVEKVVTPPPLIPLQPYSPSSPLGASLSHSQLSPESPVAGADPSILFNYRSELSRDISFEREVVTSTDQDRPPVTSLFLLEEKLEKKEKAKEEKAFKNILLEAYNHFEKETLTVIQKKSDELKKNVSSKLYSTSPVKKLELQFYQNVLKSYRDDKSPNKSIKSHWDTLASQSIYKDIHPEYSFHKIRKRVNQTGPHPNDRGKQAKVKHQIKKDK